MGQLIISGLDGSNVLNSVSNTANFGEITVNLQNWLFSMLKGAFDCLS